MIILVVNYVVVNKVVNNVFLLAIPTLLASRRMSSLSKHTEEHGMSEIISKLHKIGLLCAETKVTFFTRKRS